MDFGGCEYRWKSTLAAQTLIHEPFPTWRGFFHPPLTDKLLPLKVPPQADLGERIGVQLKEVTGYGEKPRNANYEPTHTKRMVDIAEPASKPMIRLQHALHTPIS
jgi:hypothetical protein